MELNELVKCVAKQGEGPTDTLVRVLESFIREHPEEVNIVLSPEEMAEKIKQLELRLKDKDVMIQRLLDENAPAVEAKQPVMYQNQPLPDARPRPKVQSVQQTTVNIQPQPQAHSMPQGIPQAMPTQPQRAAKLVEEQEYEEVQPMVAPRTQQTQSRQAQQQQWAKSSNPMRSKIMEFMHQERNKEIVLPDTDDE